eukprot:TRINITY_DN38522_c0_g1_i1.p1 TRINITY_DN38522_c0_g1~~TRINITY_DN38522_c0_g1_i1.p1  ORF type:complete len:304 (+),score=64.65 TRINITY_DN38522_c0_g1_i1:484-1395(+)
MGFRGGGTAGGGKRDRDAPEYVRKVPKFLQKYSHLLEDHAGGGRGDSDEAPQVCSENGETIRPLREGSPEAQDLAEELDGATIVMDETSGELFEAAQSVEAAASAKAKGNAAFADNRFADAVRFYSDAIRLSPAPDSVLYSNRSAAYAGSRDFEKAEKDALKALELNPRWGKAYARLGAALVGSNQLKKALAAYKKGLQEDPRNPVLMQGWQQAETKLQRREAKDAASKKHDFRSTASGQKKRRVDERETDRRRGGRLEKEGGPSERPRQGGVRAKTASAAASSTNPRLLSMRDDEELLEEGT